MKKIYIDAQPLLTPKSGVGYYLYNLLERVKAIDKANTYILHAFSFSLKHIIFSYPKNFTTIITRIIPRSIYLKLLELGISLPVELLTHTSCDIYFFDNFIAFPHKKGQAMAIIHDLCFKLYPAYVESRNLSHLQKLVPYTIAHADHLIVVSQAVKAELHDMFEVSLDKISVIPPIVTFTKPSVSEDEITDFFCRHKIHKNRYILFVGTVEPRKNLISLIQAYKSLPKDIQEKYDLVIAGGIGWNTEDVVIAAKHPHIKLLGYISENQRHILYAHASLFCFIPYYEGFGMPVLEAMNYNLPVITSGISSLQELTQNSTYMVASTNIQEIAQAIQTLLYDNNLKQEQIAKQTQRLAYFKQLKQEELFLSLLERLS